MPTILIAHHDASYATTLSATLTDLGYHTIMCPGYWSAQPHCLRNERGYCPLLAAADLMVYDPSLIGSEPDGRRFNVAADSGKSHPGIPVLLAWKGDGVPDEVAEVLDAVPDARVAAEEPHDLAAQIWDLIGPPALLHPAEPARVT